MHSKSTKQTTATAALKKKISEALDTALTTRTCREELLVARMILQLASRLDGKKLSGTTIQTCGVFVHAGVFVTWDTIDKKYQNYVEIGDLLLIRTGVRNGKVWDRRALLYQVKKGFIEGLSSGEMNQFHLYNEWPRFWYEGRAGDLRGQDRHITGIGLYEAARYLFIGAADCTPPPMFSCFCPGKSSATAHRRDPDSQCCCVASAPPVVPFDHYRCFVDELTAFILGNVGRTFQHPAPPRTRYWDKVIEDLLKLMSDRKSVFMAGAAGSSGSSGQSRPRIAGTFYLRPPSADLSLSLLLNTAVLPSSTANAASLDDLSEAWLKSLPEKNQDGEPGISILEIIVDETAIKRAKKG